MSNINNVTQTKHQANPLNFPNLFPREGPNKLEKKLDFNNTLLQKLYDTGELKISAHAENRLRERGIELTDERMEKLSQAMTKLDMKGCREALIITDGLAVIASITNRTVITAMNESEVEDNVFTNIDSAYINNKEENGGPLEPFNLLNDGSKLKEEL